MDPRRGDKTFPILGDSPFSEQCRDLALAELRDAGIPRGAAKVTSREFEVLVKGSDAERVASAGIDVLNAGAKAPTEWVHLYGVEAEAFGWEFRRLWYYWTCRTAFASVPLATATKLQEAHGSEVRVNGYAGGRAPTEDVLGYHVDTPAGLAALVAVLHEQQELRLTEQRQRRAPRTPTGEV